jgi:hypothetical protein
LDGDPSFSLHFQLVQILVVGVSGDGLGNFEQSVGESALAVVDVSDYAEISNEFWERSEAEGVANEAKHCVVALIN